MSRREAWPITDWGNFDTVKSTPPTTQALQDEIDTLRVELGKLKAASADEAHKAALDHAWAHFAYHANQRLVTFRFYLIAVAVLVGAYVKLRSDGDAVEASGIALLGFIISYVFLRLDFRNKDLIKLSEEVLKIEEKNLESKIKYDKIKIIEKSDSAESKRTLYPKSFGQALKFLFNLMIVLFLLGALEPHSRDIMYFFRENVHQQEQGASDTSVSQPGDKDEPGAAAE